MKDKKYLSLICLLAISMIPLIDLFHPGLPITHDGQDQVARIANFYQSLSEGNLVPRWAASLNWGYGHPILMFLYPLSSYFASFFHFLGFSLVDSTKIVFGLSFVLSGIFMYLWIRNLWGEKAGLAAGLLYMFTPYRFVDLYVRGALGENLAFVWPPLICYFSLKLSQQPRWRYFIGVSFSLAALILSHNALSLMFLPVILGYMAYLIYLSKRRVLSTLCFLLSTIFGFALSAFFWLPAFIEGKYTLRDIVTKGNITGFIENYQRLILPSWGYEGGEAIIVQVGILPWLLVLVTPIVIWMFWRRKQAIYLFLFFIFVCFWLAIFFMMPLSRPLYFIFPLLQKFQFVWRFLSLTTFLSAVFAGAAVYSALQENPAAYGRDELKQGRQPPLEGCHFFPKKYQNLLLVGLLVSLVFFNKDYWHAQSFSYKNESFYQSIYDSTTDTGESAPRWSVRFMEQRAEAPLEVISGKATIKRLVRTSIKHQYEVLADRESRLRENTLYFPGWAILVDNKAVNIEFQDPQNRGLMTFVVEKGKHTVVVRFGETKLRRAANLTSAAAATILFLTVLIFSKCYLKKT